MLGPLFNQILSPRWNSPLIRMFGLRIQGAAAPTLAPEIAPSFDANQMDDGALYFLRGEKLCNYSNNIAAAVGFNSFVQIRNPVNSGVLVVMETLGMNSGAGPIYYGLAIRTTDLTTLGTNSGVRDARWYQAGPGIMRTAAIPSQDNTFATAGYGSHFVCGRIVANSTMLDRKVNLIVPPGWTFVAYASTANQELSFSLDYRERPFLPEELATG